jgi:hypothetical protein
MPRARGWMDGALVPCACLSIARILSPCPYYREAGVCLARFVVCAPSPRSPSAKKKDANPCPPPPLFFSTTPCLKAVTSTHKNVLLSPPSPLHLHAECERLVARHLDEVGLGELRALSRPACGRSPTSRALRTRPSPPPRPPSSRPTPPRARAASSITPSPSRARTAPRLRRGPRAGSSGRRPSRRRRGARRRSGGAPRAALLPRGRENGVGGGLLLGKCV